MTPKVSIGIPAYKPEFLEEAIASVLAQTFEDWELIVVDDCSPADIKGIVGKFTDPRIRYYRNEQNLGTEDI
jgi:glycosyltransferase involved in cell wall biosynthesis